MRIRILAAASALALIAACGSETSTDGGSGAVLSDEQLSELLLTVDDLPAGYSVEESSDDEPDDDDDLDLINGNEECAEFFNQDIVLDVEADGTASVEFSAGEFGPIVSHEIRSYGSSDDVEAGFSAMDDVLDVCAGETLTMGDDEFTMELTITEAPFTDLGDRTASLQFEGQVVEFGMPIRALYVVVQMDNTVSFFGTLSFLGENFPDGDLETLADTALDRLGDAL